MANVTYLNTGLPVNPGLEEVLDVDGTTNAITNLPDRYDIVNNTGGEWNGYIFRVLGEGFEYDDSGKAKDNGFITGLQILAPDGITVIANVTPGTTGFTPEGFKPSGKYIAYLLDHLSDDQQNLPGWPHKGDPLWVLDQWMMDQDIITGSSGDDHLTQFAPQGPTFNDSAGDILDGGEGDDQLVGRNETGGILKGGSGNDVIILRQFDATAPWQVHGHSGVGTAAANEIDRLVFDSAEIARFDAITDIDEVQFRNVSGSGAAVIEVTLDQIGPGLLSNTLKVIGSDGSNEIRISAGANATVDLSGWSFTNWGRDDQIVLINLGDAELRLTIVGTSKTDRISGGAGGDKIDGESGADALNGGPGADKLTGGEGSDAFLFTSNIGGAQRLADFEKGKAGKVDKIMDFDHGDDTITLGHKVFKKIGKGKLDADAFVSGSGLTKAKDNEDRIVYDTKAGGLYFDPDGKGGAAARLFAVLKGSPDDLSHKDFLIV